MDRLEIAVQFYAAQLSNPDKEMSLDIEWCFKKADTFIEKARANSGCFDNGRDINKNGIKTAPTSGVVANWIDVGLLPKLEGCKGRNKPRGKKCVC